MYSTFGSFGALAKKKKSYIDNPTFMLHYRVTFGILLLAGALVTATQFFGGAPIQCIVNGIPTGVMNTYCWIHGTFTIPSQLGREIGSEVPHPGVAPIHNVIREEERDHVRWTEDGDEVRHAWYQWVCFVLFLQALMCYFPHYLWKYSEGGKLDMLIRGLDDKLVLDPDTFKDKRKVVVDYFLRTFRTHNSYVYRFVFCEVLNLVNILVQLWLMDVFFLGQFSTYGWDVINVTDQELETRSDPMNRVFPKVTKCSFHLYGPSGTVENKDGLCILALNIISEKIYVFLWVWYVLLTVWTAIHVMFRMISILFAKVRYMVFCKRMKSVRRKVNRNDISAVLRKCKYGDYFLLMQMCKNMHPDIFHDVVMDLRDRLDLKRAQNISETDTAE